MNIIDYVSSALIGTPEARLAHKKSLEAGASVTSGLARIAQLGVDAPAPDRETPIFILSAGWRAGSTLLQRLVMSDSRVLLWGEPYADCGAVQSLAATNVAFRSGWPPEDCYYLGSPPEELSSKWVANLYPPINDWREGQRAYFQTLFAHPARRSGATRWGLKEVRLTAEHARYLKWLYPNAKFIFLYRNPLDSYISYVRHGRTWYDSWPDKPMFTPTKFGQHWVKLVRGFTECSSEVGGLVIKYEELTRDESVLKAIESHLDITVNRSLLDKKVGTSDRDGSRAWISRLERWLLIRSVRPLARQVGYDL